MAATTSSGLVPNSVVSRSTAAGATRAHVPRHPACAAVERLTTEFGTRPDDVVAAIGPSIGPDDYEVGEALVDAFRSAGHGPEEVARWFIRRSSRLHLDLWSANRDQLVTAGVSPDRIFTCGLSTCAHPEVFDSYRSDGERAGRMAALIVVPRAR